jgi:hypothetical protein
MSNEPLDKHFRDELREYHSPVDGEALWQAVQGRRPRRRFGFWWWLGALVILLGSAVIAWQLSSGDATSRQEASAHVEPAPASDEAPASVPAAPVNQPAHRTNGAATGIATTVPAAVDADALSTTATSAAIDSADPASVDADVAAPTTAGSRRESDEAMATAPSIKLAAPRSPANLPASDHSTTDHSTNPPPPAAPPASTDQHAQ